MAIEYNCFPSSLAKSSIFPDESLPLIEQSSIGVLHFS